MKDHIAVIGAGAWGTALAIQADRAGQSVMLWARDAARAALMAQSRANERLLPGVPLPPGITVTANATQALQDAALILLVFLRGEDAAAQSNAKWTAMIATSAKANKKYWCTRDAFTFVASPKENKIKAITAIKIPLNTNKNSRSL